MGRNFFNKLLMSPIKKKSEELIPRADLGIELGISSIHFYAPPISKESWWSDQEEGITGMFYPFVTYNQETKELIASIYSPRQVRSKFALINVYNLILPLIGKDHSEPTVQKYAQARPDNVINLEGKAGIKVHDETFLPEKLLEMILTKLSGWWALRQADHPTRSCVIAVPSDVGHQQRILIQSAGISAGFSAVDVISVPAAAALTLTKFPIPTPKHVLVFGSRRKSVKVSLLEMSQPNKIRILTTQIEYNCSGNYIDGEIVKFFHASCDANGQKICGKCKQRKLRRECQGAKQQLGMTETVTMRMVGCDECSEPSIEVELTRKKLEELIEEGVARSIECMAKAISKAGLSKESVQEVIVIGGSAKVKFVQKKIREFFGRNFPSKSPFDCSYIPAAGAIYYSNNDMVEEILSDSIPDRLEGAALPEKKDVVDAKAEGILSQEAKGTLSSEAEGTLSDFEALDQALALLEIEQQELLALEANLNSENPVFDSFASDKSSTVPTWSGPYLGIDFGTTHCCVALNNREADVEVVQNDFGRDTTPSMVAFEPDGHPVVGIPAKDLALEEPHCGVYDVKRMLGKSMGHYHIKKFQQLWPFELEDHDGNIHIKCREERYSPEKISGIILKHLKTFADDYAGQDISQVILAVPVHFDSLQKRLLLDACLEAGFTAVEFLPEPQAAAIAYNSVSFSGRTSLEGLTLVFDLGGGTFDLAICKVQGDGEIKMVAFDGDPCLGGEDFDDEMVQYCLEEFENLHGVNLMKVGSREGWVRLLSRLRRECEGAKCYLSMVKSFTVTLDAVHGELELSSKFTRDILNSLIDKYIQGAMNIVQRALFRSRIQKGEIHEIVLVGGSSRIPLVRELLQQNFPEAKILHGVNPDHAVALGAATFLKDSKDQSQLEEL